jgi:hypothetical protein
MYMDRKTVIIAGAVVLLFLIGGTAFFILWPRGPSAAETARRNTLVLAEDYLNNNEYQRALDLLDKILIQNASDADARDLKDKVLARKKDSEAGEKAEDIAALQAQKDALTKSLESLSKSVKSGSQGDGRIRRAGKRRPGLRRCPPRPGNGRSESETFSARATRP